MYLLTKGVIDTFYDYRNISSALDAFQLASKSESEDMITIN